MTDRADAHIHLFDGGYRDSFTARPGVRIDEAGCYASLAAEHRVKTALVVGYAAHPWCADNNAYLARMAAAHAWVRPAAFVPLDRPPPSIDDLERWRGQRFAGVSVYVFGDGARSALAKLPDEWWSWIEKHRWLISVNSRGTDWSAWQPILQRHEELRMLVSHLGLPNRVGQAPSGPEARTALADVLALAPFQQVRVKLSGFYALTDPGHEYPHRAAWPYVEALLESFGAKRLLWASDFSPCLDWLSFPQTFGLFESMPFLTPADRDAIMGENLLSLLDKVKPV